MPKIGIVFAEGVCRAVVGGIIVARALARSCACFDSIHTIAGRGAVLVGCVDVPVVMALVRRTVGGEEAGWCDARVISMADMVGR